MEGRHNVGEMVEGGVTGVDDEDVGGVEEVRAQLPVVHGVVQLHWRHVGLVQVLLRGFPGGVIRV